MSATGPVARHPHLAEPRRAGTIRVDCHLHTCYSGDAVTTIDEFVDSVQQAALDVVCVTDHHAIRGAQELAARGVQVVVGEEIRTTRGEIIGLFLNERIPAGLRLEETVARIRSQDGIVYVPHPFDPMRRPLHEDTLVAACRDGLIDVIEGFNAKTSLASLNARARTLASDFDLPVGAGSDAHDPDAIGAAYVEMPDFDGPTSFLTALRSGRVVGHHFDPARAWQPRIIPGGLRSGEG
jgi:hypothetical protein